MKALGFGFAQHAAIVRIKTGRLGIDRHNFEVWATERCRCNGETFWFNHRNGFETKRKVGRFRSSSNRAGVAFFGPIHGADIDIRAGSKLLQPFTGQCFDVITAECGSKLECAG
ncbi:hypothetical protein D9M72_543640 [compost metagenome]